MEARIIPFLSNKLSSPKNLKEFSNQVVERELRVPQCYDTWSSFKYKLTIALHQIINYNMIESTLKNSRYAVITTHGLHLQISLLHYFIYHIWNNYDNLGLYK